jgi:hypothetical protein
MKDPEIWQDLCAQAATEQDPKKLMVLISEINRLLKEKERRLAKGGDECKSGPPGLG